MVHDCTVTDATATHHHFIDFTEVAVERKLKGESIEAAGLKGWAFYELSKIDPSRGGAGWAGLGLLRGPGGLLRGSGGLLRGGPWGLLGRPLK